MNFYSSVSLLTGLIMLAMTIHVTKYKGFTKEQKVWYLLTFISIMVCSLAEFAVHCGYYNPNFAILLTIITILQFSIAPLLGVFFSGALGIKNKMKYIIISFSFMFLIEVISSPFGWIFYFDESGYHRGNLFLIYEIFYIFSLAYLLITMIIVGKRFQNRDLMTIIMILVIIVAGIIPMVFFRINITYLAIAIAAALCYIYYNDLVQQDIQSMLIINQEKISSMQEHMISGLASVIESRDLETGKHITRTRAYVKILAEDAIKDGVYQDIIDEHFISLMYTLSPLHDLGKIVIPDNILRKPGKLTAEEYEIMKNHAKAGGEVVKQVLNGITDEEYLKFAQDIAVSHHEWWDGSGYPSGTKGEEIALSARIMAIADVYDALVSERCYKKPIPHEEAVKIIESESGTHFDPKLVDVFLHHQDEFKDVE